MAYKEVLYDLKTAWYIALDQALSIPVYKDAVPIDQASDYVLIRSDGSNDLGPTNSGYFRSVVIVVEIITKFPVIANSLVASQYAQTINNTIFFAPNSFNLGNLQYHQITQITVQSEDELYEDNDSEKTFRLIKRYEHFLNQK